MRTEIEPNSKLDEESNIIYYFEIKKKTKGLNNFIDSLIIHKYYFRLFPMHT